MYIWKTRTLAEQLRQQTLSEKDRFLHLLFFVAIHALLIELSLYTAQLATPFNVAVSAAFVGIASVGTWFCYRANRSGDGKDFIDRYVCMWLPLAVRIALLATAAMLAAVPIGMMLIGPEYIESDTWIDAVLPLGFELIFYWRLTAAMKAISRRQPTASPES